MSSWRKAKPFKCPLCKKDFDKERQLKQHLKDVHNMTISKSTVEKDRKDENVVFLGE